MVDQRGVPSEFPAQAEELRRLAEAVDEIRTLMRILVVLAAVILTAILVAGIITASTAGHVQQQLGIS